MVFARNLPSIAEGRPGLIADVNAAYQFLNAEAAGISHTDGRSGLRIHVGDADPAAPPPAAGDIWVDTLHHQTLWEAVGDWDAFVDCPVTNAANTYTRSIQQKVSSPSGANDAFGTGRITGATGTEGNDRRWLLADLPDVTDSEILSVWHGHTSPGNGQMGHIHRATNLGNDSDQIAYVVWHDVLFASDNIINIGVWRGKDGNFALPAGTSQTFDALTAELFPYWVRSRVVGRRLAVKAWPVAEPEPPWHDPHYVCVWDDAGNDGPAGPGAHGLLLGHVQAGEYVEYGEVTIRRAVPGMKVFDGTTWLPVGT